MIVVCPNCKYSHKSDGKGTYICQYCMMKGKRVFEMKPKK